MLKCLIIQNIILIEKAEVNFNLGLNILTGETGSGKSAIMQGLRLAVGGKTDSSLIRKGFEKGVIEAIFEVGPLSPILPLLAEGGIDHEPDQDLIIKREISSSGKGRIFINHQPSQLSFLRTIGNHLLQLVDQHANQSLLALDFHRKTLDLYADLKELLKKFQASYDQEKDLKLKLETLIREESQRLREIEICQRELAELDEAHLKAGEDEQLFAEYTLLSNSEEISKKIHDINVALTGDRQPILANLNRQKQNLECLTNFDPTLSDTLQAFHNVLLEVQEIAHTLRNYQNQISFDPKKLNEINERLSLLNRLKRKYGSTVEEILIYYDNLKNKLKRLENAENEIDNLQKEIHAIEKVTQDLASELSNKRKLHASQFAKALTSHLHSLNMSKAEFYVRISEQKRNREGDDHIEFFLSPNIGEHQIALKDGASGGEISRVLLALYTLLAGKGNTPTLIFDEVDANIGGETATIVGSKLKEISQQHQVICITHFPQVAIEADHHLQILKEERNGRTTTFIQALSSEARQQELARMSGQKGSKRE